MRAGGSQNTSTIKSGSQAGKVSEPLPYFICCRLTEPMKYIAQYNKILRTDTWSHYTNRQLRVVIPDETFSQPFGVRVRIGMRLQQIGCYKIECLLIHPFNRSHQVIRTMVKIIYTFIQHFLKNK